MNTMPSHSHSANIGFEQELLNTRVFVQPIYDERFKVFGYELLYRNKNPDSLAHTQEQGRATFNLISKLLSSPEKLQQLSTTKLFINFDERSLLMNFATHLCPNTFVIEVLETVSPTPNVLEKCKFLYEKGFQIALDDFVYSPKWEPFFKYVSYIKLDMLECSDIELDRVGDLISQRFPNIRFIAEKVESCNKIEYINKPIFCYFQGYFFGKPKYSGI